MVVCLISVVCRFCISCGTHNRPPSLFKALAESLVAAFVMLIHGFIDIITSSGYPDPASSFFLFATRREELIGVIGFTD